MNGSRGQLGLGGLESEEEPVLIEALAGIKVSVLSNVFDQIIQMSLFFCLFFCLVIQINDVTAGGWHSAAVSAFNDLYVWGWNVNGQIGLPLYNTFESTLKSGEKRVERQKCSTVFASPVIVDLPKDCVDSNDNDFNVDNQYHPIALSAGARHTIIKIVDGSLMATGWNKYGQLGNDMLNDDFDQFRIINKHVPSDSEIICGDWTTFVISME